MFQRIKNTLKWIPIIWKNDYSFNFLYRIIRFHLTIKYEETKDPKLKIKLQLIIRLLDKFIELQDDPNLDLKTNMLKISAYNTYNTILKRCSFKWK